MYVTSVTQEGAPQDGMFFLITCQLAGRFEWDFWNGIFRKGFFEWDFLKFKWDLWCLQWDILYWTLGHSNGMF